MHTHVVNTAQRVQRKSDLQLLMGKQAARCNGGIGDGETAEEWAGEGGKYSCRGLLTRTATRSPRFFAGEAEATLWRRQWVKRALGITTSPYGWWRGRLWLLWRDSRFYFEEYIETIGKDPPKEVLQSLSQTGFHNLHWRCFGATPREFRDFSQCPARSCIPPFPAIDYAALAALLLPQPAVPDMPELRRADLRDDPLDLGSLGGSACLDATCRGVSAQHASRLHSATRPVRLDAG
ncbi:hypothetical protein B0H14DRAFT_2609084 [Mycena olivaceomarginata]|nr:hypothetical protein B0H14DRAFT_2609084 [Mycena olivaceomarginata]